jgi:prevent-host-death family protein
VEDRSGRRQSDNEASHIRYACRITEVASRELRNNTRALLDRVEAGESVTITVDGRPVALLEPISRRPRWLPRDEFVRRVQAHQADAALAAELRDLAPDSTDDLPLP